MAGLTTLLADPAQDELAADEVVADLFGPARSELTGQRYLAVLTDGAEWRLYHRLDDGFKQVTSLVVDSSANVEELLMWLESVLASGRHIEPTPREIIQKLGADSPRTLSLPHS